jgi:formate/nitrite transporter FocA (FNT family)
MAYTLADQFRPLRLILRVNGTGIGLTLGAILLATPQPILADWGLFTGGALWPLRLAGALLLTLGLVFILAANQELINTATLLTMIVANGQIAFVLLFAYLQQELVTLALVGRLLLILIFLLCLIGAVLPVRYLRADYRS